MKDAKHYRSRAAAELCASRKSKSIEGKLMHIAKAAALKALADNEEWLAAAKERPHQTAARKNREKES
jgi:hypothetical protein